MPPTGLVSWWTGNGNTDDIVDGSDSVLQGGAMFAPDMVGEEFVRRPFSVAGRAHVFGHSVHRAGMSVVEEQG